jgi:hypothetical protein
VVGHYESFFITSAGASAAILGLLVVAVTVVNADDSNLTTRENRTVLAGSAFVALVDIFIVSIVALTGAQTSSGCQASQWQPSACWLPDSWYRGHGGLAISPAAFEPEG